MNHQSGFYGWLFQTWILEEGILLPISEGHSLSIASKIIVFTLAVLDYIT